MIDKQCSCYIILLTKEVMQHMKITKAYQFRLYLTKEQEILIHKTFGCTRFLYNQMLKEKKKAIKPIVIEVVIKEKSMLVLK